METKNYLGSKGNSGLYQFIINKMPKHDIYIEPFFGTGVIASKKKPSPIDNIGIEVDEKLYSEMTMRYPHFNFFNENSIKTIPCHIDRYKHGAHKILIYFDPPYLWSTRSDLKHSRYKHEMTDEDHKTFLSMAAAIKEKNIFMMISGYKNDLYMSMLENWNYFEFETMSRGGPRTESLWCNFNPDDFEKHQYDYVGHNFVDRQRIKRKSKRLINKFRNMSYDERTSIIKDINEEFGTS